MMAQVLWFTAVLAFQGQPQSVSPRLWRLSDYLSPGHSELIYLPLPFPLLIIALAVMSGLEGLMLLFNRIFALCKAPFVSIHYTASPSSFPLFQMEAIYFWWLTDTILATSS